MIASRMYTTIEGSGEMTSGLPWQSRERVLRADSGDTGAHSTSSPSSGTSTDGPTAVRWPSSNASSFTLTSPYLPGNDAGGGYEIAVASVVDFQRTLE